MIFPSSWNYGIYTTPRLEMFAKFPFQYIFANIIGPYLLQKATYLSQKLLVKIAVIAVNIDF